MFDWCDATTCSMRPVASCRFWRFVSHAMPLIVLRGVHDICPILSSVVQWGVCLDRPTTKWSIATIKKPRQPQPKIWNADYGVWASNISLLQYHGASNDNSYCRSDRQHKLRLSKWIDWTHEIFLLDYGGVHGERFIFMPWTERDPSNNAFWSLPLCVEEGRVCFCLSYLNFLAVVVP